MIPALQEIDAFVADEIDDTVFLGQAARPYAGAEIFQGLGFADSGKGVAHDRLDKVKCPERGFTVCLDPEAKVFTEFRLEHGYEVSSLQAPSPCEVLLWWRVFPRA
jgi:hypothetical protein